MKVISKNNNVYSNTTNKSGDQRKGASFGNGAAVMGALGKGLQFLDANPMASVTFLDVSTAIGPNTAIDAKERNPVQAFETFRRESSGLLVNCILPIGVALATAMGTKDLIVGKEFKDIKSHKIWAGKDTIEESTIAWRNAQKVGDERERYSKFVDEQFSKVEFNNKAALGPDLNDPAVKKQFEAAKNKYVDALIDSSKEGETKISKKVRLELQKDFTKIYGESKSITINGKKKYKTSLNNYIRDNFALSKAFNHKSVNAGNLDKFSKGLTKMLKKKSAITMFSVGILAFNMQRINRNITEKVSGKKGYQGYKDNSIYVKPTKEEKKKLLGGKLLSIGWFAGLAALATGKPNANMFNFLSPQTTMNQARTFALLTNAGRMAASEDKNELKDSTIRDTMIFMNLYVLGDYVQKGIVSATQKFYKNKKGVDLNLMNEGEKLDKNASPFKKAFDWVRNQSVKSFDEIEGTKASKGVSTKFRKNIVTAANLSSIAYSLVALGIVMPRLIAKMTQKNREKQLQKLKLEEGTNYDTRISMAGRFANSKTQDLFKAFKS